MKTQQEINEQEIEELFNREEIRVEATDEEWEKFCDRITNEIILNFIVKQEENYTI